MKTLKDVVEYSIQGFGAGEVPTNRGIPMAIAFDEHYAKDICKSLAKGYPGQMFGYLNTTTHQFSPIYRWKLEETQ